MPGSDTPSYAERGAGAPSTGRPGAPSEPPWPIGPQSGHQLGREAPRHARTQDPWHARPEYARHARIGPATAQHTPNPNPDPDRAEIERFRPPDAGGTGYVPRHVRRKPGRKTRVIPLAILVCIAVSAIAFVAVGIGLGGALFVRDEEEPGVAAPPVQGPASATAPCQKAPEERGPGDRGAEAALKASFATQLTQLAQETPDEDPGDVPDLEKQREAPGEPVTAVGGTDRIPDGGNLDDVAIWIHPTNAAQSVVIGTDGECNRLFVYDLAGRTLQAISLGTVGSGADGVQNVDVRRGFKLAGRSVDLVVATDQSKGRLAVWRIDPRTRRLSDVTARNIKTAPLGYGLCMYTSARTGSTYAFVTQEEEENQGIPGGLIEQWELFDRDGKVDARKVRTLDSGGQSEGCAADDDHGVLYIANEEDGILRFQAEEGAPKGGDLIARAGPDGPLTKDVEGLALVRNGTSEGYLIASSQGSDSFALFDRIDNRFLKSFHVRTGANELVTEIDGIDATSADLGAAFPKGMFVVQDDGETFKLTPLDKIVP
jgi:3-phytase